MSLRDSMMFCARGRAVDGDSFWGEALSDNERPAKFNRVCRGYQDGQVNESGALQSPLRDLTTRYYHLISDRPGMLEPNHNVPNSHLSSFSFVQHAFNAEFFISYGVWTHPWQASVSCREHHSFVSRYPFVFNSS